MENNFNEVLNFWFSELSPEDWFKKSDEVDNEIKTRFFELHKLAKNDQLDHWQESPDSSLALIILLDQFSRNLFRDSKEAFAFDEKALKIAKTSIDKAYDLEASQGRKFFYLPLMHSENIEDQRRCVELFTKLAKEEGKNIEEFTYYARRHLEIIELFGRFPHRNEILGRKSTKKELEFLKTPNSSF